MVRWSAVTTERQTLASPLPERVNKWTGRSHVIIVRQTRLWLQAVHLLQADILHQMVLAVLSPAGDVLHVVRVIHRLVPRLVPLHLTVTSQWVLWIIKISPVFSLCPLVCIIGRCDINIWYFVSQVIWSALLYCCHVVLTVNINVLQWGEDRLHQLVWQGPHLIVIQLQPLQSGQLLETLRFYDRDPEDSQS